MGWQDYWEHDSSVYVSQRHKAAHYDRLADDLLDFATQSDVPLQRQIVMDFGCGEALSADRIASKAGRLILSDGSSRVSDQLQARFGSVANITVLKPGPLDVVADGSLDLIVVNSVLQYVEAAAAGPLLAMLAAKLAPSGQMLVADVLPPDLGAVTDARELLKFAAAEGFLVAAVVGLARAAVSDYARTRARHGLTRYTEADFGRLAASAGLRAERLPRNLGHNPYRLAFVVRPSKSRV
ncbi:MAG: SAM-dependent methyltransferase [Hyphomicrobium sp.]|nr:SAM-dependent methyltransferase [Hyphomicrobium sp.]PPC81397.1 MAG: SAM-dependent methyltransferase [Hyphomicrobium sp.]